MTARWEVASEDFIAANRKTAVGSFCAVHVTPNVLNDGGNDDEFRVTINTSDNGGQPMYQGSREIGFISFVVVGRQEMLEIPLLLERALGMVMEASE